MAAFSIRVVTFLPGGVLEGGKVKTPGMGAVVGWGVGAGGPWAFPAADAYVSGSSAMDAAVLV